MMKFALFSGLVLSASCMVLHQPQIPYSINYYDTPNYSFAYDVNDAHTGDIKSQHESRRGDTVLGQYSLLQPDGIRRTVDYRADGHAGFLATVNNEGRNVQQQQNSQVNGNGYDNGNVERGNLPQYNLQGSQSLPTSSSLPVNQPANVPSYLWPAQATPRPTQAPVAISRSSIVQTFTHSQPSNPWI